MAGHQFWRKSSDTACLVAKSSDFLSLAGKNHTILYYKRFAGVKHVYMHN
ncbi:hypothetical protein Hanom_Chr03g00271291 [Helianthus anomalus]